MEGLAENLEIDMVVFDIDGTLLDFSGIHPELIPLVRQVEERGVIVSLASGRALPNITPIRQALGVSGFIVAENGGVVWDSSEGHEIRVLADGSRPKKAAQWLATQIEGFDIKGIESNRWRETEWCMIETGMENQMRELLSQTEWSDLLVVSTGFAIHITCPGIDKEAGLRVALKQRGINPSRVLSCGDALNDISMFGYCGYSVAVNSSLSEVVEAADFLTESDGLEGTVELLKALLDIL